MKQAQLIIIGTVQGVGYRYSAQVEAENLGLKGYVRNIPDGGVEAIVQGEESQILAFAKWCKEGPMHAKVENVKISWQDAGTIYDNFEIL